MDKSNDPVSGSHDPEDYGFYEEEGCLECDGTGEILVCIDDICHGLGYCIHGDGMMICPKCNGGD